MTKDKAAEVIARLEAFHRLERKNTDEAGWIQLAYSCSRRKAERMIADAREMMRRASAMKLNTRVEVK